MEKPDNFAWNKAIQKMDGYPKDKPDRLLSDEETQFICKMCPKFLNCQISSCFRHTEAQDLKTAAAVNAEWVEWIEKHDCSTCTCECGGNSPSDRFTNVCGWWQERKKVLGVKE